MSSRGYRWALFILAAGACAAIAWVSGQSLVLAVLVFAVVVSAAAFIESG